MLLQFFGVREPAFLGLDFEAPRFFGGDLETVIAKVPGGQMEIQTDRKMIGMPARSPPDLLDSAPVTQGMVQ